jgi:glycerol kinase
VDRVFKPKWTYEKREKGYKGWLKAVARSRNWVER